MTCTGTRGALVSSCKCSWFPGLPRQLLAGARAGPPLISRVCHSVGQQADDKDEFGLTRAACTVAACRYGCEKKPGKDITPVAAGLPVPGSIGGLGCVPARHQERIFPLMLALNAPDLFSYRACNFKVCKDHGVRGSVGALGGGRMRLQTYPQAPPPHTHNCVTLSRWLPIVCKHAWCTHTPERRPASAKGSENGLQACMCIVQARVLEGIAGLQRSQVVRWHVCTATLCCRRGVWWASGSWGW